MAKMRNRNGYGTVVKLSGKRRRPYQVRVNTRMNEKNQPVYDVLGYFADRMEAQNALAAYNLNPYNVNADRMTFEQLYNEWYEQKYNGVKVYSASSASCTQAAFNHCFALHDTPIKEIKAVHMQQILDNTGLSHATLEHIKNLFNQMFKYAMKQDYITKDYSPYVKINIPDDDVHGVPFNNDEIKKLWKLYNSGNKSAAFPLILIYTGWRIKEFATCSIDLDNMTMTGGVKTTASKNRIIPIHSKIQGMVKDEMPALQGHAQATYNSLLRKVIKEAEIETYHTCHDCRHTFASLLSSAYVPDLVIKRLMGHADKNITEMYTHKDIEELRNEIEKI